MAGNIDTSRDAVERMAWCCDNNSGDWFLEHGHEAADMIRALEAERDRLAAEVAKMREALAGVLDVAKNYGGWQAQDDPRCVAARAALAGGTDGK